AWATTGRLNHETLVSRDHHSRRTVLAECSARGDSSRLLESPVVNSSSRLRSSPCPRSRARSSPPPSVSNPARRASSCWRTCRPAQRRATTQAGGDLQAGHDALVVGAGTVARGDRKEGGRRGLSGVVAG